MSREIYTYPNFAKLKSSQNFQQLMKYPQIAVSTDLRKCLTGSLQYDKIQGMVADNTAFRVAEFHALARAIDKNWTSDQSKFHQMILLSEFMRKKLNSAKDNKQEFNWLTGCMRNLSSLLSAITLLEQTAIAPDQLEADGDRNIVLMIEAWKYLEEKDPVIGEFREKMQSMTTKEAWQSVFDEVFHLESLDGIDTVVFHGFYYFTPHQERIMSLLEQAGFHLIFLFAYDERYPYAYEIWDKTYSKENGYVPKLEWHIEKSEEPDAYGEIFEGRDAKPDNKLTLKEYASITEFVNDMNRAKEDGIAIYSADFKYANEMLKDYFPEAFGDRKILSYPVGQFVSTLNRMWDEDAESIVLEADALIECFSSGWLAIDGISGRQYLQDLTYVLPFFNGCKTISDWEKRIAKFREIEKSALEPFETELDTDIAVSRWQEAISSPLKNFSMFSVAPEKLDIILRLIQQLLNMARELFGKNEPIRVQKHIETLDWVLRKHERSQELYAEERELVADIFDKLSEDNSFDVLCSPSDIARAVDLYICGRYEEGEIQTNKVGMVYPLYFVDVACVKNKSRVHVCLSDIDTLPGRNKDYIWPLTEKMVQKLYDRTDNPLLTNIMWIMQATTLCNRYFTYCALKNKEITLSWISTIAEKKLSPSPYIKLVMKTAGVPLTPSVRDTITNMRVASIPAGVGKILPYDNANAPVGMIKEARMDYALCPMKYTLSYILEKYPTYQSDFQISYAINGLISAVHSLMKEEGVTVEQAFEAVMELFPNMRKAERRQIYDYVYNGYRDDDINYAHRTECGGRFYTDERLKIHFPNEKVRREAAVRYGQLSTPDGRTGMNLYEYMDVQDACSYCSQVYACRNARYSVDEEKKHGK